MSGESRERIGIVLRLQATARTEEFTALARFAEECGFESIWVPETWGLDAATLLGALAVATDHIALGSGVFNIYSRSAALIAQSAATLQFLSGGRFRLGLGTGAPAVVERWHGVPFREPMGRTRAYVEVIRRALSGAAVNCRVDDIDLAGFRLAQPWKGRTPIYLAALGPRNIRLAGEIGDGWLLSFSALGKLAALRYDLERGLAVAGRGPGAVDRAAMIPTDIAPNAESRLRRLIVDYAGSMAYYARFLRRIGFAAEVERVAGLQHEGRRRDAIAAVTDEMIFHCTLGPDAVRARAQIVQLRAEGLALPILVPTHGLSPQALADLMEGLKPQRVE